MATEVTESCNIQNGFQLMCKQGCYSMQAQSHNNMSTLVTFTDNSFK